MGKKVFIIGFAALLTAMVVFASGAALIAELWIEGDPKESQLPYFAFIPALLVAAVLAVIAWRSANWFRFAGVQVAIFAVIFGIMVALGF